MWVVLIAESNGSAFASVSPPNRLTPNVRRDRVQAAKAACSTLERLAWGIAVTKALVSRGAERRTIGDIVLDAAFTKHR
jgi:hypothetical protein